MKYLVILSLSIVSLNPLEEHSEAGFDYTFSSKVIP